MTGPFRVGLQLTDACDIACEHCWLGNPKIKQAMTFDDAKRYIEQTIDIPSIEWVSFTGGEPFLLPSVLHKIIKFSADNGLKTECVTNCSWATDYETTVRILKKLKSNGLDVLNISVDDFHQQFVPFSKVQNSFEASQKIGLKTIIMNTTKRTSKLRLPEIIQRLGPDKIKIVGKTPPPEKYSSLAVETPFIPVGRGAKIPQKEWLIDEAPIVGPCHLVLKDIGIDPKGELLACCSAASLQKKGRLGNIRETNIQKRLDKAHRQTLFKSLEQEGPVGLADKLDLQWKNRFISKCHLCYEVLQAAALDQILI
jgi:organic radical activating enzyme